MYPHVHWHEGLFLQPHHLQVFQRQVGQMLSAERRLGWAYPYGLIEAELASDVLATGIVQFDRLHAVMPSGLVVDVPGSADLPAVDIRGALDAGRGRAEVHLGVPLWYARRANAVEPTPEGEDGQVKRLYKLAEVEQADENTGDNAQAMMLRRINARLVVDEDSSDLETLPLLRVERGAGEDVGAPRADATFVPPCLLLGGSAVLGELVRDLVNQVEASRKELALQLGGSGFNLETLRGRQVEEMMRLRTLNRFAAWLPQWVSAPGVSPFEVYLALRQLLGELAAGHPDRDPFEAERYNHDAPYRAFSDVAEKIRSLLRGAVRPSFMHLPFQPGSSAHVAELGEEHFSQPNDYYLAVRTREDAQTVGRLVEDGDRFKLMARSMVEKKIFGVRLQEERNPPMELPREQGLHYFRLNRAESTRMWERVQQEKALAARWPGMDSSDFSLSLYMTVPGGRGER